MTRTGFWRRAAAMVIDIVIVFVVTGLAYAIVSPIFGPLGPVTERDEILASGVAPAAWLVYFLIEGLAGVTLGKRLLRIVIARADGAAADHWTLLLRYSTKHLPWMFLLAFALTAQPLFYWLAGIMNLIIAFGCLRALGEDRVAWHDIWCHTAVFVRERAVVEVSVASGDEPLGAPPPT